MTDKSEKKRIKKEVNAVIHKYIGHPARTVSLFYGGLGSAVIAADILLIGGFGSAIFASVHVGFMALTGAGILESKLNKFEILSNR